MKLRWTVTLSLIGGGLGLLGGFGNYPDSAGIALGLALVLLGYGAVGGISLDLLLFVIARFKEK